MAENLTKDMLWELIEPMAQSQGCQLFELEAPTSATGSLRVFLWKPKFASEDKEASEDREGSEGVNNGCEVSGEEVELSGESGAQGGVTLDNCTKVSRQIFDYFETHPEFGVNYSLEVSSPGINHKLTRPEHYRSAKGERIKLKLSKKCLADYSLSSRTLSGKLERFDGFSLLIDIGKGVMSINLSDVEDAQIDFIF